MTMKGQITTLTAVIAAAGMILASAMTGWFSASNRVGMAETKISVVEERENNHYKEIQKQLDTIDKKLDVIIGKNQTKITK